MAPRLYASHVILLLVAVTAISSSQLAAAAQAGACSAPAATVTALSNAVSGDVTVRVAFGGNINGTFEHSFVGCSATNSLLCSVSTAASGRGGDFQNGYCIDADTEITPGTTYSMVAYSSFTAVSEMRCPGAQGPALKPAVTADALRRVNWLINTYYNPVAGVNPQCYLPEPVLAGTYQSRTATPAGLTAAATREDVQQAIWTLLGSNRYATLIQPASDATVNCLLWNAYSSPLPETWTPPCSGTMAVVLVPCAAGVVVHQPTLAQISLASAPGSCACQAELLSGTGGSVEEVSSAAVAPQTNNCSAPQTALAQFAAAVDGVVADEVSVKFDADVNSGVGYFRHWIDKCQPASLLCNGSTYQSLAGQYENGYCIDTNRYIDPNGQSLYTMVAYSSFSDVSTMKCPGATEPPLKNFNNADLRNLNWLLNNYYNPQQGLPTMCTVPAGAQTGVYQGGGPTLGGTYGPITKFDMQAAVWFLTGNSRTGSNDVFFTPNNDTTNCLIYNTLAANVPVDYTPPCNGVVAVVMVPCDGVDTNDQISVASVPLGCTCQEPGPSPAPVPSPSPEPIASPSPLPEVPSPSPAPLPIPSPDPVTPSPSPVVVPSPEPVASPSPAPLPEPSPSPEPVASPSPNPAPASPSPEPVASPSPNPEPASPSPEPMPEPSPSPAPVASPSPNPGPASPAPVASPSPQPPASPAPAVPSPTPEPIPLPNCTAPVNVITDLNNRVRVNATMHVAYGGSVVGYFRHYVSGCQPPSASGLCTLSGYNSQPGVFENGYCIDTTRFITPGEQYDVAVFSSLDPTDTMKCPGSSTSPLSDTIVNIGGTLDKVNWLLNKYYVRGYGLMPTCNLDTDIFNDQGIIQYPAGNYGPITAADMQTAIWDVTGNTRGNIGNPGVVNCLTYNAGFAEFEVTGYRPPCGGVMAVVMIPCQPGGMTPAQISIASVPVDCDCTEPGPLPGTPSPSPAPVASPSPAPAPSPAPVPSPAPLPSPGPGPLPSGNCSAPASVINQFNSLVRTGAQVKVAYGGPLVGTFHHYFVNCTLQSQLCVGSTHNGEAGVYENGYCIDTSRYISPGKWYPSQAFSSYSDVRDMKCPGNPTSPLNPAITNERLRRLNWMLNFYYNPRLEGSTTCTLTEGVAEDQYTVGSPATPAGTYGPITREDMQAAVWVVTGNTRGKLGNNDVINCLIHNTLTVVIPPNYTPPCDGTVAVVVIPCRSDGSTTAQITIANVEIPIPCDCQDQPIVLPSPEPEPVPESPSPSPTPPASPSPVPLPEPSPSPAPVESPRPSPTPTPSPGPGPNVSPSPGPDPVASPSPSPLPEPSPGPTPAASPSPAPATSPSPGPVPSPGPGPGPDPSPSPEPLPEPSPAPVVVPSPSPGPVASPSPGPGPGPGPSPNPSPEPLPEPSPSPAPAASPSPGPVPNPSPSPAPPQPDICSAPPSIIAGLTSQVEGAASARVDFGAGVVGYFRHAVTNCNPARSPLCVNSTYNNMPGVYENGYCIDTARNITPGQVYSMRTFSSYTDVTTMRCPGARIAPLNANITQDTLRRLNWLLNTYYNQQLGPVTSCTLPQQVPGGWYQSISSTPAGTYGPITNVDMQAAVWVLTGNNRFGKSGWGPGQAVPAANDNIVNCLVYHAYMASVPETYTPPCGGTMAVIMMPCDVARATGRVRAMMVRRETYDQVTVTQVPVQCECVSQPSPTPVSSPSPAPLPEPSPVPVASPSPAPVASPSPTPGASPSPMPVSSPSPAPLPEPSPSPHPVTSPSPTPAASPSPAPIESPAPLPEPSPSPGPVASPSPTPPASPSPAPLPEPSPSPAPVASPSPTPGASPSPAPLPEPSPSPAPAASPSPTNGTSPSPAPLPEPSPSPEPVASPSPAPVASPSPAPVPNPSPAPPPANCSAAQSTIADFASLMNGVVAVNVSVQYVAGVDGAVGYFRHWIEGCQPAEAPLCSSSTFQEFPGQYENGYCADTDHFIDANGEELYTMVAFSSFTDVSNVKCPNGAVPPKLNFNNANLRNLNWLLNNYYNPHQGLPSNCELPVQIPAGQYNNTDATAPGTYGPISAVDMQSAVWQLTGNSRSGREDDFFQPNNDVVNCLVYNTLAANVPATYTPPCNGAVAVIMLPCNETGGTDAQITVVPIGFNNLGLECICEEPGALPSPAPVPSPSPKPAASPSPSPEDAALPYEPSPSPAASPEPSPTPAGASPSPTPVKSSPSPTPGQSPQPTGASPSPTPGESPAPNGTSPSPAPLPGPSPTPGDSPAPNVTSPSPTPKESPAPNGTTPSPAPLPEPSPTPGESPAPNGTSPSPTPAVTPSPSPSPSPENGSLPEETSPSPVVDASPSPTPAVSPSPTPQVTASPNPNPQPSPTPGALTCEEPQWSLAYSQGWWSQNYCAGGTGNACSPSSANRPTACSLQVPSFQDLPANLQEVLQATAPVCSFAISSDPDTLRTQMCTCLAAGGSGLGDRRNSVAFVFNVLMASQQGNMTNPQAPATCANATYTPVAATHVCTAPRANATCSCPTKPVSQWNSSVSPACREFINEGAVHLGKCMPATTSALGGNCQVQACACVVEESGPGPQLSPSPAPLPEPSPSPGPVVPENTTLPSPGPAASPSPTPENTTLPSPGPAASPSPTPENTTLPSPGPAASPSPTPENTTLPSPGPAASPSPTPENTTLPSPGPAASPSPTPGDGPLPEGNSSSPAPVVDASPSPIPNPSPFPTPENTTTPSPSPNATSTPSPSPGPEVTPTSSPSPNPLPGPTTCESPQWSASFSAGWWKQSYCERDASCQGSDARTACALEVLPFNALTDNLKQVLQAIPGCTFTSTSNATLTRDQMCGCMGVKGTVGNVSPGERNNMVAFVFNVQLGRQGTPANPAAPSTCSAATYTPLAATYVCKAPGATGTCDCPPGPVWSWNSSASNDCRDFVNAQAVHEGKCMPGAGTLANCQVQACACEAGGSLPSPEAVPSPSPNATTSSPSPNATSTPSPSPNPEVTPTSSPSPTPLPGPTTCESPQWSASFSAGWWKQSYCERDASCQGSDARTACALEVLPFNALTDNLKQVLQAIPGCTFTSTSNATLTRDQMCGCMGVKGTVGNVSPGERNNMVAFVFNVQLGRQGTPANPAAPSTCSAATYTPLAATYVCKAPGATGTCDCPPGPVWSWNSSASNDCRDFVNAQAVHEGKCMPRTGTLANCQVQACACEAGGSLPSPEAVPSPSPKPATTPSPSPNATATPSPSPAVESGAVPSPSPAASSGATKSETASGWFYKDATYSCPEQGIEFGTVDKKCNTVDFKGSSTLCSPKLGQGDPTVEPCCTPCKDLPQGGSWFWQCKLPGRTSDSATYKFNMLAGQFYYGGACNVTITSSSAAVSGCTMADGWTASKVDVYLSTIMKTDNCAPGSFGFSESLNPPQSGNLAPGKSITVSSGQDVFVMLHMDVTRPL